MALIERVRALCLALPEAFEVEEAWEQPTFRIGSGRGKMFCIAVEDGFSLDDQPRQDIPGHSELRTERDNWRRKAKAVRRPERRTL